MRYANLFTEDMVNGEGTCVSLFVQGCPFHCEGCHNPETWDFNGGKEIDFDTLLDAIITAIGKNGIHRNFSVLGGEPLAAQNIIDVSLIILAVRQIYPDIKIYLWTGYDEENLPICAEMDSILDNIDVICTGPFILAERDVSQPLIGSRNQKVIRLQH